MHVGGGESCPKSGDGGGGVVGDFRQKDLKNRDFELCFEDELDSLVIGSTWPDLIPPELLPAQPFVVSALVSLSAILDGNGVTISPAAVAPAFRTLMISLLQSILSETLIWPPR